MKGSRRAWAAEGTQSQPGQLSQALFQNKNWEKAGNTVQKPRACLALFSAPDSVPSPGWGGEGVGKMGEACRTFPGVRISVVAVSPALVVCSQPHRA